MNAPAKRLLPVLPTTWIDGRSGRQSKGPETPVVVPAEEEVERYGAISAAFEEMRVCGACVHFDLENGQKEIVRQHFYERLVREEEWKIYHLGAPPQDIGLCGASNGETVTSKMASAHTCDMFRRRR